MLSKKVQQCSQTRLEYIILCISIHCNKQLNCRAEFAKRQTNTVGVIHLQLAIVCVCALNQSNKNNELYYIIIVSVYQTQLCLLD